jgi:predicted permease
MRLSWNRSGEWLRADRRGGGEDLRHGALRELLVVVEVALALTIVVSAALLVKSLVRLQRVDPGFRADGLISFRVALPDRPYEAADRVDAFLTNLDDRLRPLPGVRAVAAAMSLPPNLLVMSNDYSLEGTAPDSRGPDGVAEWNVVSADYFATMGIRVVEGRGFDDRDRAGSPGVAVVNEAFVRRHFRDGHPIGRRLKGGTWSPRSPWITIVGVAADVPYQSGAWAGSSPMVYTAYSQNLWLQSPYIVVRASGDLGALVPPIRAAVAWLDARIPLRDVATMTERLDRAAAVPRLRGAMFSTLGGLALFLAITGLFGVMSYHVSQRQRETAIRRALGARSGQILRSTVGAGLRLALAGIALGVGGALASTRALGAVLFRVEPRDPAVIAGAAALLAISALAACVWPAVRAVRIDPAAVLNEN